MTTHHPKEHTMTSRDRLREMRDHVGIDPHDVAQHPDRYNRADRRLAAKIMRERPVYLGKKSTETELEQP